MKYLIAFIILFASCAVATSFVNIHQLQDHLSYPEGYRNWTHIKTAIVGPKNPGFSASGGFHHIYANEKAMEGYSSGRFPDGSVIVFDVLEALVRANSDTEEGNRRHIDVMEKDSVAYVSTGGWGYEEFDGDSKTERKATVTIQTNCFNCHANQKNAVFSTFRK